MNHLRGPPQGEHQVPQPPPVARSISNKERGLSFFGYQAWEETSKYYPKLRSVLS